MVQILFLFIFLFIPFADAEHEIFMPRKAAPGPGAAPACQCNLAGIEQRLAKLEKQSDAITEIGKATYLALRRIGGAETEVASARLLQLLSDTDPDFVQMERGRVDFKDGTPNIAIARLGTIGPKSEHYTEAALIKALAHRDLRDYAKALETLGQARKKSPQDPTLLQLEIATKIDAGKFDEAIQYADGKLAQDPQSDLWQNMKAYALAQKGTNLEEAKTLIEKALTKNRHSAYYDTLGWIQYKQGLAAEANGLKQDAQNHFKAASRTFGTIFTIDPDVAEHAVLAFSKANPGVSLKQTIDNYVKQRGRVMDGRTKAHLARLKAQAQ